MKKFHVIFLLFALILLAFAAWQSFLFIGYDVDLSEKKNPYGFEPFFTGEQSGVKQLCYFSDSLPLLSLRPNFAPELNKSSFPVVRISKKLAKELHLKDSLTAVVFDKNFRYPYFFRVIQSDSLKKWETDFHPKTHDEVAKYAEFYLLIFRDLKADDAEFWRSEKIALRRVQEKKIPAKFREFKKIHFDF
jgi:hypothetical protein